MQVFHAKLQRFEDTLQGFTPRKKKIIYLGVYTILFLVTILGTFMAFRIHNKGFIWEVDSLPEHIPKVHYWVNYIKTCLNNFIHGNFTLPMYDFSIGLGYDSFMFVSVWFIEPINLLLLAVPEKYFELGYYGIVILRFYLAGLAFSYFSFYMKKSHYATLIGSFVYAFCGFALYGGVRHTFYVASMIYLPFLFVGIEQVVKKKKFGLFTITVCLSTITSFYFLYINSLLMVTYYLVRFFCNHSLKQWKKLLQQVLRLTMYYLLGVGLAAVALLPTIYTFLASARTNSFINENNLFFYSWKYILRAYLYLPVVSGPLGKWSYMGFAAISYFCIVLLYAIRNKKNRSEKIGFIVLIAYLLLPVVGMTFSMSSFIVNRWCYGLAFLVAFITTVMIPNLFSLTKKQLLILFLSIIPYGVLSYVYEGDLVKNTKIGFISLVVVFILLVIVTFIRQKVVTRIIQVTMVFVVIGNIYTSAYILYSPKNIDYIDQFYPYNTAVRDIKDTPAALINEYEPNAEENVNRIAQTNMVGKYTSSSTFYDYPGISYFHNMMDKYIYNYNLELDNISWAKTKTKSFDDRTYLNALAHVKYYATTKKWSKEVPYGFKMCKEKKVGKNTYQLYENEYLLPFGITYSNYTNYEDYEAMNSLEKQEAMLQSVIISDDDDLAESKAVMQEGDIKTTNKENKIKAIRKDDTIEINKDSIVVGKDGGSIYIDVESSENSEVYLKLTGFGYKNHNSSKADLYVKFLADQLKKDVHITGKQYTYHTGQEDFLINLGYHEKAINQIEIRFPSGGTFSFNEMKVYSQSMDNYTKYLDELKEDSLQEVEITTNHITGNISLDRSKMLVLSLPYHKGWSATVNGEKVKLQRVNSIYTGILLEPGDYTIELTYCTPWLKLGATITSFSILAFGVLLFIKRKKNKTYTEEVSTL